MTTHNLLSNKDNYSVSRVVSYYRVGIQQCISAFLFFSWI